jgi:hypothetical protein
VFNFIKDIKEKQAQDHVDAVLLSKHAQSVFKNVSNVDKDLVVPSINQMVWIQTDVSFNTFDIIAYLSQKEPIKQLYASTYSISRKAIEKIIYLHDTGKIEQLTLLISDSMIKRNPSTIDNLMAMKSTRANLQVKFAWIHAKVNLIETHDNYYVLEGSGNWSENAHYEQYVFINSKEVFDFRKQLFTNVKQKVYELS